MLVTQELQSVFCQECDSDGGYGYDGDAYGGGDGGYVGGYGGDSGGSTATVSLQSEARSVLTKAFIEARWEEEEKIGIFMYLLSVFKFAIALQSLYQSLCFAIALLCNRFVIALQSLCNRFINRFALQSLCFAIAL
jgi:hypothetical protein